ncbi:MAG TPA: glycosyltransferase family 2 protein [Chloroflexi bacterium]|jgi:glycosyltransferase involved in cell wall biosynthesis|nr:glycosyltransferase family 2 protein [Chloroflexota bacterium]
MQRQEIGEGPRMADLSVSIAIPVLNESERIARVIETFRHSAYESIIEILVADGGSKDRTREIVCELATLDPRIRLIENPGRLQAVGLNLILAQAKGSILLRADAHSDYADDYVERSVEALVHSGALNAGGAQRFVATSPFQAGQALAARSVLGSGGAKYRDPEYEGYAETVYLGCYWKDALLQVGGWRPPVHPNEDAELNLRLSVGATLPRGAQPVGRLAIFVSRRVKVWYYPRLTWTGLWRQYFRYGRGRRITGLEHPGRSPIRSRLPLVVLSSAVVYAALDLLAWHGRLQSRRFAAGALVIWSVEALRVTWQYRKQFVADIWRGDPCAAPSFGRRSLWCLVALLTEPLAYFAGQVYQTLRVCLFWLSGRRGAALRLR